MSLDNFQEHFSSKDSMKGVALKRPWLQTMLCTIRHANSNITIQNCKEQKSEHLRQKERSMTHQACAKAPDFIQDHPVQRRPKKPSVSSADNLLEPMVFTKLQHFKWTVKFETGQPFSQNCSADSVPGTWSPRTPSTIRSSYQCCTTVLERQSLRDPSTKPMIEKYQVLSSPFST